MNIEEVSLALGVNVSANILEPASGDLLVIKVPQCLNSTQRKYLEAVLRPMIDSVGCKVLLLEAGADVVLVKKVTANE